MNVKDIKVHKTTLEKQLRLVEDALPNIVTDMNSYFIIRTHLRELFNDIQPKKEN